LASTIGSGIRYATKAEAVGAVASNGFMLYRSSYLMIVTVSQSVSTAQRLSAGCPEDSLWGGEDWDGAWSCVLFAWGFRVDDDIRQIWGRNSMHRPL